MRRWVDVDAVVERIEDDPSFNSVDADVVREILEGEPAAPDLVARKRAAEILGVNPSHIRRLEQRGRLTESVPIDGYYPALVRSDVERLAAEMDRERERRAERLAANEEEGS